MKYLRNIDWWRLGGLIAMGVSTIITIRVMWWIVNFVVEDLRWVL